MKIPETSANVGAYYGNEENGQWQPNGVIIDSGVGGGVVGSGDAGIHRPPVYPVHMPRAQVPAGYVVAGAYYGGAPYGGVPAAPSDDFADYMWMEHEEEFDKQVMQQLEEEALMEQCIEAMLEDEQRERTNQQPTASNGGAALSLAEAVSRSTLNPLAAEFVPTTARHTEQPPVVPETESEAQPPADTHTHTDEGTAEAPSPPSPAPAPAPAPAQPPAETARDRSPRDAHKDSSLQPEHKPKAKLEPKPKAKSETKVPPNKKEVRSARSEGRVGEKEHARETGEEGEQVQAEGAPKPPNYAAAARASKPKKPAPPASDNTQPKPKPTDKRDKKPDKVNVQRKHSTK